MKCYGNLKGSVKFLMLHAYDKNNPSTISTFFQTTIKLVFNIIFSVHQRLLGVLAMLYLAFSLQWDQLSVSGLDSWPYTHLDAFAPHMNM